MSAGPNTRIARPGGAAVITAAGSREAELRLLEGLHRDMEARDRAQAPLAPPILVIVPSGDLRRHLAVRIVRSFGRSVLGLKIVNVWHLAHEIVAGAGVAVGSSSLLLEILARRLAAGEEALREELGRFSDGFAPAARTIRLLLRAGIEPSLEPQLVARLRGLPSGVERRAAAIVRGACRTFESLRDAGLPTSSHAIFEEARRLLEARGRAVIAVRSLWLHGFSEVEGPIVAFLRALAAASPARLVVEIPPDPVAPDHRAPAAAQVLELAARIVPGAGLSPATPGRPSVLSAFTARGARDEIRELAWRVRRLLDEGVEPERIGVLAQSFDFYAAVLRQRFHELGIPFSGSSAPATYSPLHRRLRAALEILRRGSEALIDDWLDACGPDLSRLLDPEGRLGPTEPEDLRLAFRTLACARLRDAVGLDVRAVAEGELLPLGLREGLQTIVDRDGEEATEVAPRRKIRTERIERAVAALTRLVSFLDGRAVRAPFADAMESCRTFFAAHLGWTRARAEVRTPWEAGLEHLATSLAPDFLVDLPEVELLLERALASQGGVALGGRGAGVQVLEIPGARGLTFEHLFVIGLNRGVFPRGAPADPLLPDIARERLRPLLPELPLDSGIVLQDELRFAQVLDAAPDVTLSWQWADEDGTELLASAFVDRLRLAGRLAEPAKIPDACDEALARAWADPDRVLTLDDAALLAGLRGSRQTFRKVVAVRLGDELAAARVQILDEIDPDLRTPEGRRRWGRLGPYLGFLGREPEGSGPAAPIYVTAVETMAGCPWKALLARTLKLEASPDPVAAMPALSRLVIGNTVHRALEGLVRAWLGDDASSLGPAVRPMPRPTEEAIAKAVDAAADETAREEGLRLPGLISVLRDLALRAVRVAIDIDWSGGPVPVAGVEVERQVQLAAGVLRFKADRIDWGPEGLRLSDYKTGRPPCKNKSEGGRRSELLRALRAGRLLQAAIYAALSEPAAAAIRGRYLYLDPELDESHRVLDVSGSDAEIRTLLEEVVQVTFEARGAGVVFPRLESAKNGEEPRSCKWCELSDACLRGDSGARRRLAQVLGQQDPPEDEEDPVLRHARALWNLEAKRGSDE